MSISLPLDKCIFKSDAIQAADALRNRAVLAHNKKARKKAISRCMGSRALALGQPFFFL
jgi:hypothetical protein